MIIGVFEPLHGILVRKTWHDAKHVVTCNLAAHVRSGVAQTT